MRYLTILMVATLAGCADSEWSLRKGCTTGFDTHDGPATGSYPTYRRYANNPDVVQTGETIPFNFGIFAHLCGGIEILGLQVTVKSESFKDWLAPVRWELVALQVDDGPTHEVAAYPRYWEQELVFNWSNGYWDAGPMDAGLLQPSYVAAGEMKSFGVRFPATEFAGEGTTAEMAVTKVFWRDEDTGQVIISPTETFSDIRKTYIFE